VELLAQESIHDYPQKPDDAITVDHGQRVLNSPTKVVGAFGAPAEPRVVSAGAPLTKTAIIRSTAVLTSKAPCAVLVSVFPTFGEHSTAIKSPPIFVGDAAKQVLLPAVPSKDQS
jgi:hypothetical protein